MNIERLIGILLYILNRNCVSFTTLIAQNKPNSYKLGC